MISTASSSQLIAIGGAYMPYCGAPPVPAELAERWNFDPVLLVAVAALAAAHAWLARRAGAPRSRIQACAVGWLVTAAAFVSPLCSLGVALFSARVAQHLLLVLVAAPLLALGVLRGVDAAPAHGRRTSGAYAGWLAFALAFWFWHAPGPYAATFRSDLLYWLMHGSLLLGAVALWHALLAPGADQWLRATLFGLTTALHLGFLGALLTFAPAPLYAPHQHSTAPWGLTPLADQQLGGVLCWVVGCTLFLAAGLRCVAAALRGPRARGTWPEAALRAQR